MTQDNFVAAIIGYGNIGHTHAKGYLADQRVRRLAVADPQTGPEQPSERMAGYYTAGQMLGTERPEAVVAGTARLVGTEPDRIVAEVNLLLDDPAEYQRRSTIHNPYGDGRASQRILQAIRAHVGLSAVPREAAASIINAAAAAH